MASPPRNGMGTADGRRNRAASASPALCPSSQRAKTSSFTRIGSVKRPRTLRASFGRSRLEDRIGFDCLTFSQNYILVRLFYILVILVIHVALCES